MSVNGWQVIHGRFDGWAVILDLEKQSETPYKISSYTLLMLNQLPTSEGLSASADFHTKLLNQLQAIRVKEGWEILAGPKHLAKVGLWTVSLWVKHDPGE